MTAQNADVLAQSLKPRHVRMLSIAGVIGAGLFVGSGHAIAEAGPAVLLAYIAAGALVISLEANTAGTILYGWFPKVAVWEYTLAITSFLTISNLFSVKNYGEFEFWFALLKVVAIVAFLCAGSLALFGLLPGSSTQGISHLYDTHGFMPNYAIDGVQFDDYFYTKTATSPLNDSATFRQYGQGFASKADWRRHNTQLLIEQVSRTIKQLKPGVEFGVSPAGVWRNLSHDAAGSDTRGAAAYDEAYADTRRWVQLGLLDYIAPQLYWPFARQAARYDVLARWWANVVQPTHTRLYIGVALYKVGEASKSEPDWTVQGGVPELKNSSILMNPCHTSMAPFCFAKITSISCRPSRRSGIYVSAGENDPFRPVEGCCWPETLVRIIRIE